MEKLFLILISIIATGLTARDEINPEKQNILSEKGESVTLSCTYSTDRENVLLYWYRQYPNQAPQYLLVKAARSSSGEHSTHSRFTSATSRSSTTLYIDDLTMADTALYYCALGVATGILLGRTHSSLTFGKGTRLIVSPKDQKRSLPTLSILKSDGKNPPQACLATGFYPNFKMEITTKNGQNDDKEEKAVLSTRSGKFFYARYSDPGEGIDSCKMENVTTSSDQGDPHDVTESNREIPTSKPCENPGTENSSTVSPFVEKAYLKQNFMSLAVNGLRVLFAKMVAFNTIITIKAIIF